MHFMLKLVVLGLVKVDKLNLMGDIFAGLFALFACPFP